MTAKQDVGEPAPYPFVMNYSNGIRAPSEEPGITITMAGCPNLRRAAKRKAAHPFANHDHRASAALPHHGRGAAR